MLSTGYQSISSLSLIAILTVILSICESVNIDLHVST